DHWPPAGLSLDGNDAEVLLARQEHGGRPAILVTDLFVGQTAQEVNVAVGLPLQALAIRPVANNPEPGPSALAGVDGQIDSLVRDEGRHNQKMAVRDGRIGMVKGRVDGWMHDRGLPIIVSADPPRNVLRVRNKPSDS